MTHSTKLPFLYATHRPDQLEPREATLERPEQLFAAVMILNVGFMDQHAHDQPNGIDEQMPLAPFHALAAIVAAPPPYTVISKQDPLAEGLSR